jgi:hypothetical protein
LPRTFGSKFRAKTIPTRPTVYRFLHTATHGQSNSSVAFSSALFLVAEPERPAVADPAALESAPDGPVTGAEIVRTRDRDADLVNPPWQVLRVILTLPNDPAVLV